MARLLFAIIGLPTIKAALTIGTGSSFITSGGNVTVVGVVNCTLSDNSSAQCLSVKATAVPDHAAGPWCNGGDWLGAVYNITLSYNSVGYDCNTEGKYTVCPTTDPTCTRCLECAVKPTSNTYLFPLSPKKASSPGPAAGDFNYGSALGLNGIPLAGADPVTKLVSQKNPAPLDWCGGHSTLQYVYHYHVVPLCITTATFGQAEGWNSTNLSWSTVAPNGQHSKQIGWAFDGYPIFGPYTEGGVLPVVGGSAATDTDSCYGHTETANSYGYHYHARTIHDGSTHPFLGCVSGVTAQNSGAPSGGQGGQGGQGGPGGPTAMACAAGQTSKCCGDRTCDGPETASNCAADCASGGGSSSNSTGSGKTSNTYPVPCFSLLSLLLSSAYLKEVV